MKKVFLPKKVSEVDNPNVFYGIIWIVFKNKWNVTSMAFIILFVKSRSL